MLAAEKKPRAPTPFENVSVPLHADDSRKLRDYVRGKSIALRDVVRRALAREITRIEKEEGPIPDLGGGPLPRGRKRRS